jgi:hypothetical protein
MGQELKMKAVKLSKSGMEFIHQFRVLFTIVTTIIRDKFILFPNILGCTCLAGLQGRE